MSAHADEPLARTRAAQVRPCPEAQADGVPCEAVEPACEDCERASGEDPAAGHADEEA